MKSIEKKSLDGKHLQFVAQAILEEAKRLGANQAEVSIDANKGFSVSATKQSVETVEYHQDKSVEITVYFGKRSGSASLSDISDQAIHSAVEAACHIAKFTDQDPAAGLAEKEELAFHYPQLDLYYPWDITVEKAMELAIQCEQEALSVDQRIMIAEEVKVLTMETLGIYANSYDFIGYCPSTIHEISCVLVAKDDKEMQRDYSYTMAIDPAQLVSPSQIAKEAAERTLRRLGARSIRTTRAPVIFSPEEARGLLGHFASSIQGSSIYRKSSFMVDQLGKKVFPAFVQLAEQPHLPRAFGSSPFDDEGVATRANVFVKDGVLQSYALGVYSARKLGMKTTGNSGGMHNLTISPGNQSLADLLKTMGTGLVITELMGHGVNLLTGDYSRGAGGY